MTGKILIVDNDLLEKGRPQPLVAGLSTVPVEIRSKHVVLREVRETNLRTGSQKANLVLSQHNGMELL